MKRALFLFILLTGGLVLPAAASAEFGFVVGVTPGIFLYSPDADGHQLRDAWRTEEIDGYISNLATVNAGVAWEAERFFLDITGGAGYLYNESFSGELYMGDLALRFKLPSEVLTLGPHVSLIDCRPDWDGGVDVSLSGETGVVVGLGLTVGTKPFSFAASIDYVDLAFDVAPGSPPPVANEDLDLSGLALQIGALFRF